MYLVNVSLLSCALAFLDGINSLYTFENDIEKKKINYNEINEAVSKKAKYNLCLSKSSIRMRCENSSMTENRIYTCDFKKYCQSVNAHETSFLDGKDSGSQEDIVMQQYKSLPYPPRLSSIEVQEKKYYQDNSLPYTEKIPFNLYEGMHLEALNHFLYKGENAFRWVGRSFTIFEFGQMLIGIILLVNSFI